MTKKNKTGTDLDWEGRTDGAVDREKYLNLKNYRAMKEVAGGKRSETATDHRIAYAIPGYRHVLLVGSHDPKAHDGAFRFCEDVYADSKGNEMKKNMILAVARYKNPDEPKDVVKNWMRSRSTIEFLGLWEQLNNAEFKGVEFDSFIQQALAPMPSLCHLRSGFQRPMPLA